MTKTYACIRATHEDVVRIKRALDAFVGQVSNDLRKRGYSDDVIALELAWIFSRRAAAYGIALLESSQAPVNGHGKNGAR